MPSTWLQLLEFDRLREILVSLTSSHLGRESLAELRPFESPRAAEEVMELVDAMVRHTITVSPIPAIDVPDLSSQLARLTHGGAILTPEALMELGTLLRAISRLHGALKSVEEDSPLKRLGAPLEPKPHLERALDQTFEPSGEIRDGASSDLRRIRRERERTRERLRGRLQKMASDLNGDQIVTLREGRFVLSISQNEQGKVKGLVQDRSNSGQTLFVEPLAVVEENNDLRSKDAEERAEIQKILMALTAKFAQEHEVLNSNYQHLGWLDTMRARARLAQRWQGEPVQFATDSVRLEMSGARHPLLLEARDAARNLKQAREEVIPLALRLDEDHRIMMVTGPNMGGKTVALKCIGLLTAMAQCGCLIPADPGCVLPWLNHWVVDLGDEQSLENDLSTFGAHVKTWGEAIKKAGPRTLVLLDELGSGTDPGEGTALAQSVLEKLVESGGLAIVSTHLSGLKGFAAESEGIENASMRFDPETVHPTFRLEMGVPGESHAIDMARRLGFPEEQVQRAEALLPKQERDLKKLLDDLNLGQRNVREKERELDGLLAEAEADRQKARQKLQRFLDERQELRARAARQARSLLQRAEQDAKQTRVSKQKVDLQGIRKEQARLARLESGVAAPAVGERPDVVVAGESYWAEGLNREVQVVRLTDGGRALVEYQGLRVELAEDALRIQEKKAPQPAKRKVAVGGVPEVDEVVTEVDLRGMRADEAQTALEIAVDRALLASMKELRVIHGFGTGALQRMVSQYCKTQPAVKSHRFGEKYEGGGGATVITLEK